MGHEQLGAGDDADRLLRRELEQRRQLDVVDDDEDDGDTPEHVDAQVASHRVGVARGPGAQQPVGEQPHADEQDHGRGPVRRGAPEDGPVGHGAGGLDGRQDRHRRAEQGQGAEGRTQVGAAAGRRGVRAHLSSGAHAAAATSSSSGR
jgi:hypothetical protein